MLCKSSVQRSPAVPRLRCAATARAAMPQVTEFEFVNARNQRLSAVEVLPDALPAKGVLLWHHGLSEHKGRYLPMFEHVATAGYAVYSFDAHGHGKSDPTDAAGRAVVWRFDDLVDDFAQLIALAEQRVGGSGAPPPEFLGGQSLGGLVAAHTLLRYPPDRFAGLALFSAALDVVWTPLLRVQAMVGGIIATLVPTARIVPAVRPEDMHPSAEVVREYLEDPLNTVGPTAARTGNEILKAFGVVNARVGQFSAPILAVHGSQDLCTSLEAVRKFCGAVPAKDVTLRVVEGGFHELLMAEPERGDNARVLAEWMGARLGGAQSQQAQQQQQQPRL